jgi:hypothetical protein
LLISIENNEIKEITSKKLYDDCYLLIKRFLKEEFLNNNELLKFPNLNSNNQEEIVNKESNKNEKNPLDEELDNYQSRYNYNNNKKKFEEEDTKNYLFILKNDGYNDDDFSETLSYEEEKFINDGDKKLILYINSEIFKQFFDFEKFKILDIDESVSKNNESNFKETPISIENCLDLFTTREQLNSDNTWYCPKCEKLVQPFKKIDIWTLPDYLVIHLKRFQFNKYSRTKIDTKITCNINIDLSKYILNQNNNQNNVYELIAVSNHYGGLNGGHYTAYAKGNFINES